ncbi:tRNA lysidine(34) synthetase TilS [Candidatus Azoamicus ciliaticola]|uniref:tRNA(Ile)-lysidine synthase n=1 Tax=Candidatus Azoamicus ciliaticola TaxID=2652803 RepID=A0A6J5JVQ3_9GAMM|nr:tRNA lysidine(34) synthetase TilS [Candidatus Azoamicus ciliaticola]CAB3976398.1 tRNA(Ile)-lysidine synthase [Candidatus Azoamicus ciliaticola]
MFKKIHEKFINFKINRKVYIGYSGGIDSSVLLHLCFNILKKKDFSIRVININYMNNKNAKNWYIFCKTQCYKYKIPITTFFINSIKDKNLEQELRIIRYKIFLKLLNKSTTLLLAHNSNDIIETFFLNLFRGCGITGFSSISDNPVYKNFSIFRPMTDFNKDQIFNYATKNNINYITDFTNFDIKFNRNFIRYNLFNEINKKWQNFKTPILRYIDLSKYLNLYIKYRCNFFLKKNKNNNYLNLDSINFLPSYIKTEILKIFIKNNNIKPLSYKHINELNKILINRNKFSFFKINNFMFYINLKKLYIKKIKTHFFNFKFLKSNNFYKKIKNSNSLNFNIDGILLNNLILNIDKKKHMIIKYDNFLIILSGIWKSKIYSKFLRNFFYIKVLK